MNTNEKKEVYFLGQKVSEYGVKCGFVDYGALSKTFQSVINNKIIQCADDWVLVNGTDFDEETEEYDEIFTFFIIDERGKEILTEYTDGIIYYSDFLGVYLWGITHYGTSWDYVLTDIKIQNQ